jgi:5-methylcytosine-specific restriction endonuclease McrA
MGLDGRMFFAGHDKRIPRSTVRAVYERAANLIIADRPEVVVCEDCWADNLPLELHHLRYEDDNGNPIHGHETLDDLALLCRECHHGRHIGPDGEFYRDPEDVVRQWDNWWHLMESSSYDRT